MTDSSTNVHELHPPGDRATLRARAAEQLIQATELAAASHVLFDLIAVELKLNVFLVHALDEGGEIKLLAHGGLTEAEAHTASTANPFVAGGRKPEPAHFTHVQERDDGSIAALRRIGIRCWLSLPLMAGEQLIGLIGFGRRWTESFDEDDKAFLRDIGRYLALAMERVRSETMIRDGEERLRLGMAVAGFGTLDFDLVTGRFDLSPKIYEIIGLPPDQPLTLEMLRDTVHPDDRERVHAARLISYDPAGPGEYLIEQRVIRPDGGTRWVHVKTRIFFAGEDKARRATRVIGVMQDITEHKLAEERLRDSEERLRLAMETAGFGIFEYDVERDESVWSPELRVMYGIDPDATISLESVVPKVHPDDREKYLAPVHEFANGECFEDLTHEYRIFRPNGEMRWLSAMMRRLFDTAQSGQPPTRIIGVVQDITERKLAEERLRQSEERLRTSEQRLQRAQELAGVASFEWNHTTTETWVSESYREFFGFDPSTPLGAALFQAQLHPDDRERVIARFTEIPDDVDTIEIEYRITRPNDGQERWIYSTMGVLRDPATGVIRLAGIALDITERKRDEERERLLSREVDHRAKNLLSVVQAMVQLTHAPTIPAFVDQIKGRIHALGRAHSLLAASRWSGAELAQLIAEEFAPFADDAGRVRLAGPAIALRPAAAQSMALMIHELTTNAAKYGALSSPTGQVEVRWEIAGPGELQLCWRERGGPPVTPPTRFGFGLTHIRGSVERQLGGTLDLQWLPHGLQCRLSLPARQLASGVE